MAFVEGYDVETVQDISSDLFCVICLKLMRNPVQFKCGHGMCFVCFKSLLHRSKQKATTQCPQCREVVKEGQIVSNVMLHRIILSLHVLCGNHDNGCKWTGELDRFDEHFAQCTKHSENAANKKSKKKKKRADQNQQAPQNIQNELLLQITEQLSNLKEYIISPNATKTQDSDPNSTDAAMKPPFWTRFNNKSVTSSRKTKTLALILFTISLLSGMHILGGGFSDWFMDEDATANQTPGIDHVATYQQVHSELAKMNSLIYAQQNNFFQLHLGSKELQSDLEAQKTATLRLMGLYLKNSLNAAHFTKTSIADDVDDVFSQEMMHRKLGLERTAGFQLVNMKEDAYARLKSLQNQSLATLTVFNATDFLTPFLKDCKAFQRDFAQQIIIALTTSENLVTHSFQQARRKMAFYVAKESDFTGFDYEDVKKHLVEEREKSDVILREKLNEAKQEEYVRMLRQEYKALNQTYHEMLLKSISQYELDASYQNRAAFVFSQLENVDFGNGRYLWRMNSSLLPLLPTGHGYYSEKFTTIEAKAPNQVVTYAKLWLLRTSVQDNTWKVTYEQYGDSPVKIKVLVVNHKMDKDLECVESFRQTNEKDELIIDFDIPFSLDVLEENGYIVDEKILVKERSQK